MQYLGELYENVTRKTEALRDAIISAPEGEVLVRQATNDEKWGPSGSLMLQIADMTHQFQHLPYISQALWDRLSERRDGRNWRTVYKALLLLDYVLKNGSEQFVNEARQHSRLVSDLSRFNYVDSEGVDRGISVRERAKIVYELIHDTKTLREERKKAKANRGKFTTSISSNSGGFGNQGFGSQSRYAGGGGGFGGGRPQRRQGDFGDDSDDDLDLSTRNKTVFSKHKAPDALDDDWSGFSGSSSASKTTSTNKNNDDDDWADFTGSRGTATAAPAATAPAAAPAPQTIDLLGTTTPSTTAAAPASTNVFSAFSTPAPTSTPSSTNAFDIFSTPASSAPAASPAAAAPLFATPTPAPSQPNPPIVSLIDASPSKSNSTAPSSTTTSGGKDLFDFGILDNKSTSKPLAATVSTPATTPAATPSFTTPQQPTAFAAAPQPAAFGAYAAPVAGAAPYAYPVAYAPAPAGYAYPPGYVAQPPPGY